MSNGKALLAVLAGIAAGAAVGLIFAPRESAARKKISRKGEDLANALSDKIDERFDELLNALADKVRENPVSHTNSSANKAETIG